VRRHPFDNGYQSLTVRLAGCTERQHCMEYNKSP
jgi:hypothetical protein